MKKLKEAMDQLERISRSNALSENEQAETMRKQYEFIIHVLVDEVLSLNDTVRSLCEERD